jgi:hypothetical protein
MTNSFRLGGLALILLGWHLVGFSQIDSSEIQDSSIVSTSYEQLLEQISLDDGSPNLDDVITPHRSNAETTISIRSRIVQSLQQSNGYTGSTYLGSRIKSYQRLKFTQGEHFSAGILFEKDPGEQRLNDFSSMNVTISKMGPADKLVLGDYVIETGQGLALWRGYDFSKGADIVTPGKRDARILVPYISADENAFFRGIAGQVRLGAVQAVIFYSKRSRTASVDTNQHITSFTTSGYFRTSHEQERRDNVSERITGFRAAYHFSDRNMIGVTSYGAVFSNSLLVDNGRKFSGSNYAITSVDYNYGYDAATFFGEWAHTGTTIGGLSGIALTPADAIDVIAVFRDYPYQFTSLHGLGFGERSITSNETGLYIGMHMKANRWLKVNTYYDQYRFPQPTPGVVFPSKGNDFLIQTEWKIAPRSELTIRYQRKISEERFSLTNQNGFQNNVNDLQRTQHIRCNIDYRLNPYVKLRSRIERIYFNANLSQRNEKGMIGFQDFSIKQTERLWWNVRFIFFQTESFDSRIYEYENDLEGVFSLPGLYGRGVRWYVLARYKLAGRLELSLKYADLIRDDVKRLGTGLDELPTNHDNRFGLQIDFSL